MRITRIELAGETKKGQMIPDIFATIRRHTTERKIIVEILQPTGSRTHCVRANSAEDLWSMAECLQESLDGAKGTNSMINDVYRELLRFSDI